MPVAQELINRFIDEPKAACKSLCDKINGMNKSGLLKLVQRQTESDKGTFDVRLVFDGVNDKFIDKKKYADGTAYIYPNNTFYDTVESEAAKMGFEVNWNNDRSVGWVWHKKDKK